MWSLPLLSLSLAVLTSASNPLEAFESANNASLLWGPYRPNLYFGVRPRIPNSLLTSLLWARVDNYEGVQTNLRHTCEQNEGMHGYGWDRYDPRVGGVQSVRDVANGVDISTGFVKSADGQSWGVRISGKPREGQEGAKITVIFSVGDEGVGLERRLEVVGDSDDLKDERGIEGDVVLKGDSTELGKYKIVVTEGKGKRPETDHLSADERDLERTLVVSQNVQQDAVWQTKNWLFGELRQSLEAWVAKYGQENVPPPWTFYTLKTSAGAGNHHLIQKTFEGDFEFDVLFSSAQSDEEITSDFITTQLKETVGSFDSKFDKVFKPKAPFASNKYAELSKSLFSNLLGGIGYFHGDWKADRSYAPEYEEENEGFWEEAAEARAKAVPELQKPAELFTSIPSRPFFPRGFLWDEGFHLMPVMDWDIDLALEIVRSWFKLIDDDGWIAREQILGEEARTKVPEEFQVQYPHYANPPTLFLILVDYVERLTKGQASDQTSLLLDQEKAKAYLAEIYPLLLRHYEWFRRTQQGDLKSYERTASSNREGYRWRGRTPRHILPSGLDDYPRAQPPHPGELHVDAISWVGLMAKSLQRIAEFVGEKDDAARLKKQEDAIKKNIDDLHWDAKEGVYCDSTIDQFEEEIRVCHKGYISLFPFMMGLMKHDDPKIGKLLDAVTDSDHLWSEHGIRSLSKTNENYGTDENYWRSPIWININYLIVDRLLELAQTKGPHQKRATKTYMSLRKNLINTVSNAWDKTGFAWEQYNPETGDGQRTQHFTGWTSLAVKLMAMPDLDSREHSEL